MKQFLREANIFEIRSERSTELTALLTIHPTSIAVEWAFSVACVPRGKTGNENSPGYGSSNQTRNNLQLL